METLRLFGELEASPYNGSMTTEVLAIRPATATDESFLREMLYQALFTPPGSAPPPRDIVHTLYLRRYVDGWGKSGDMGFIATANGRPVGAIWARLLTGDECGYGYVDEQTPELSLAVLPAYRGRGIGSQLLAHLLAEAARRYQALSLSVSAANPARRLYERHGFVRLKAEGESETMIRHLD